MSRHSGEGRVLFLPLSGPLDASCFPHRHNDVQWLWANEIRPNCIQRSKLAELLQPNQFELHKQQHCGRTHSSLGEYSRIGQAESKYSTKRERSEGVNTLFHVLLNSIIDFYFLPHFHLDVSRDRRAVILQFIIMKVNGKNYLSKQL